MSGPSRDEATLLTRSVQGDRGATDALAPLVYERLRGLAHRLAERHRGDALLQPTALVHEAWLHLSEGRNDWRDRTHFYAIASHALRQVLVDHLRHEGAQKRGAGWARVTASDLRDASAQVDLDVLALHEALDELAELDPRAARIVEMRFFAGMSGDEIAAELDLSRATVVRELAAARLWLRRALGSGEAE